ncbi:uncharacterized protein GGS22DRAFT_189029 [Annulohypoxylon maeteangense]|uniref:uncharacterized protein n=1 Tax=Annulohypoxylon maeteangense TaxID=1927788 RepID=UPI002008AC92|nr:uncharacterized protein GGS22DRAFT_189029 [Annulohypoxylon maeteangense]KAI0884817.1 hypothetical protein GGS22DRAFT_189029 [Annulohypoxylon maeteangense]
MCVEVWNTFQSCNHRVYQSKFPCSVARQCAPGDDLTLKRTKFLPDKIPKLPPGDQVCKTKVATRPLSSRCPMCAKEARMAKITATATNTTTTTASTSTTSSPPVELTSSTSSVQPGTSPSPGGEGIKRLRDSLVMLDRFRKSSI